MRCVWFVRFLAPLLWSIGITHGQTVISNFNVDSDGWTAYTHADPSTTVGYAATDGTGGSGAIVLQEPANGANDYFVAPAKFTGDFSAYYGGTVSLDLKLNPSFSGSEAAMIILTGTYNGNPLSIGYLPPSSSQYPNTSSFTTYALSLNTSTAWALTDASDFVTGSLANTAQFQAVLATVSSLRILGDWSNSADLDLLDNVTLAAIPEPSALALASVAGVAGLFTFRRRQERDRFRPVRAHPSAPIRQRRTRACSPVASYGGQAIVLGKVAASRFAR